MFPWTRRTQFWQHCWKNPKKQNCFSEMSESENNIFWEGNFISKCSCGNVQHSFENPIGSFWTESQKLFAQCLKMLNRNFFQKQMILLKMFLWTCRKQFWQAGHKTFYQLERIFRSMSKNDIKHTVFRGKILHKKSLCTRENSVVNPFKKFSTEGWKVYTEIPKVMKKRFFQKQMVLQRCSYGNVYCLYCLIDNPAEHNRRKKRKRFADWPEMITDFCSISEKIFNP